MATLEQRLTELETRIAFLDSTVNSLDLVIARQDRFLLELERAFDALRADLGGLKSALDNGEAHDEAPPPHY